MSLESTEDEPMDETMNQTLDAVGAVDDTMSASASASASASPSIVLSWLQLLNHPENNQDPRDSLTEGQRLREYRRQQPSFSVAAVSWPRYAVEYWDTLRSEILNLFSHSEERHNFAQWVLEYARETNPPKYKCAPAGPKACDDLVRDLYDGRLSPLHMAAVLGLPDLTRDLDRAEHFKKEHKLGQLGLLGSPLFCALMGPAVLETGTKPTEFSDVYKHSIDAHRLSTIRCIVASLPTTSDPLHFKYSVKHSAVFGWEGLELEYDLSKVTLAGLTFWAAASCNDLQLIEDVLPYVAKIDDNLLLLLEFAEQYLGSVSESVRRQAFITLLDYSLGPHPIAPYSNGDKLHFILEDKLGAFENTLSPTILKRVPDSDFASTVLSSILDGKTLPLARLATDPRFDANAPGGRSEKDGTIAHLAVSGDQLRIVQILINAGADFARVDEKGRTPLLVSETLEMLKLLVLKNGFSTSVTDNDGRNLWHYACATNDAALLNWLCQNDPGKETNIQAVTHNTGWTPLDEAIGYIVTTKREHYQGDHVRPKLLLRLLDEMRMCNFSAPRNVNVHLAVGWSSLEVVDGLVAIGANFRGFDAQGNTVLHGLNFAATPALVRKLLAIVGPEAAAVRDDQDRLPAETIFTNTFDAYVEHDGQLRASGHPACGSILDQDTFRELLRSGAAIYTNLHGQGIWERISELATGWLNETKTTLPSQFRDNFFKSVTAALQVLVSVGALHEYEVEVERSALETLQLQYSGQTVWEPRKSTYLELVICHSGKALLKEFYTTKAALTLLIDAWWSRCFSLVGLLARTGMPLHMRHSLFEGLSFVEMVLTQREGDVLSRLYGLLNNSARKYFIAHTHIIYKVILHSKTPLRRQMLLMLLSKGLDPNPEPALDQPNYYLPMAIDADGFDVASLLLKFGADPTSGRRGYNALLAAAAKTELTLMADVISAVEDKYPAFAWDSEYEDESGTTFNALQMAALRAHDRMLLLLLQTPLRYCINHTSSRNAATPAHLAAKSGSVESLQVLLSWGADTEIRNGEGLTALEVALEGQHVEAADFLRRSAS